MNWSVYFFCFCVIFLLKIQVCNLFSCEVLSIISIYSLFKKFNSILVWLLISYALQSQKVICSSLYLKRFVFMRYELSQFNYFLELFWGSVYIFRVEYIYFECYFFLNFLALIKNIFKKLKPTLNSITFLFLQ